MNVFLTGASGYLGQRLAFKLASSDVKVHALIRRPESHIHLQHPNIKLFYGDILEKEKLKAAMDGCEQVFHVAALARTWVKDRDLFYKVNVEGTSNVLSAAISCGIKKFVFTSTTGVLGPSFSKPLKEKDPRISSFDSDYDLSKYLAEKEVRKFSDQGMKCVIVSPSRIYGPGIDSHSAGVNKFIKRLLIKGYAFAPNLPDVHGNYCYIDDVVNGHILAMEKGRDGEKYIIGGENLTFSQFFQMVKSISLNRGRIFTVPYSILMVWGWYELIKSKIFNNEPIIDPALVRRLSHNLTFDCGKAISELGYSITPFHHGMQKTYYFILENMH